MKILLTAVLCLLSACIQASSNGGPKVGDASPLLSATALLQAPPGATLDAASLRGTVVVLEFWATWCGPCVAAIPHLNDLADQFKDKPVRFIALTAEDATTIQPFLKKRPIHAWIALDTNRSINMAFAVAGIPHTVVLDKEGKIAAITYPAELTARHLSDLLAGKKISLSGGRGEEVSNQKPNDKPALFEISVRPSNATNGGGVSWGNGKFNAQACTVWRALPVAFDTTFSRIVTSAPLPAAMYDFTITEPREAEGEIPVLLQTALKITFGLTGRKETRATSVLLLRMKTPTAIGRGISPTESKAFRYGARPIW
jgi:thiol-disulfide isomerase/thioredoxin